MKTSFDEKLLQQLKSDILAHSLPKSYLKMVDEWLLDIAQSIVDTHLKLSKPIIISINGAQGSGKSTISHFLSVLLNHHFNCSSINLSLDDFYLTKQQRSTLAKDVHPLLRTRGVPGTHDINLALQTFKQLQNCSEQKPCLIPQFDKAIDDRKQKSEWVTINKPINIILFEGWCNHAPIQTPNELLIPLNNLEDNEDANTKWRTYANEQLKIYHEQLFSLCDSLIFIKIPSFSKISEWRGLQETKLSSNSATNSIMNKKDLIRFLQFYERITHNCLKNLPLYADTVISIDNNHNISDVYNKN